MDYAAIAKDAGCLAPALPDVVRRVQAHFQGEEPSPEAVRTWLTEILRPVAGHLWPEAPTLPPGLQGHLPEQITWAREQGMVPVYDRERRRFHPTPPQELTEAWNKLPPIPRRTAQLEWEAAQQQGQG